ncbi:nucleotidyltransferase family protein [Bradyrhizobium sp. NC92]|uniref:nucleotidyltransferase family protein n=1 Tax=Bradyrhizobium sp. (strain NC92) TaxID=55395 RepID=UPI00288A5FA1|nr:nucleotidyltransferase family protein [Bradyrhizobium sp. NC92]
MAAGKACRAHPLHFAFAAVHKYVVDWPYEPHRRPKKAPYPGQGAAGAGATSLYLFGSTARDEARAGSDLDLFIDYDPRGSFNALDLVAAKRLLEESLGVEVDLTTRNGLHPLIRRKIEAEATKVF